MKESARSANPARPPVSVMVGIFAVLSVLGSGVYVLYRYLS